MTATSIQDRTNEFRAIITQAQKRNTSSKATGQRASLLTAAQKREANGEAKVSKPGTRSDFARNAAQIGRGIMDTTTKLEKLARRRIFYHIALNVTDVPKSRSERRFSTTRLLRYPNSPT